MSDPLQPMDYTAPCSPHTPSFTISWYLFKFMSIELVMLFSHHIFWHPLLLLPSIIPSIRVFSSESALHIRWLEYWSFSFSMSPSNEWSGLVFFYYQFLLLIWFSSVQFSCSVVSGSSRPHGPQHARPPCPSPTPGTYSNSCPLSQWCHPTISSSVVPFSSHLQSFPASGSALCIRWPKYWSFSFSISPSNEYSGLVSFRMNGLDLLAAQGTLKSLLQHHSSKASILRWSVFFIVQLSYL